MSVNSVSFVFHLALKNPGIAAQIAPTAMLATVMTTMSSHCGIVFARQIMQAAQARPPASTCPSAPMFQKRILNEGVTASEMQSRIARFWNSAHAFLGEPKPPLKIAA